MLSGQQGGGQGVPEGGVEGGRWASSALGQQAGEEGDRGVGMASVMSAQDPPVLLREVRRGRGGRGGRGGSACGGGGGWCCRHWWSPLLVVAAAADDGGGGGAVGSRGSLLCGAQEQVWSASYTALEPLPLIPTLTHSLTCPLTHSIAHSFTQLLTHSTAHSLNHSFGQ